MSLSIRILNRDFTTRTPSKLRMTVTRLGWGEGGPDYAEIECEGGKTPRFKLAELLRCPVEIYDGHGAPIWWGYVSGMKAQDGAAEYGVSLDSMYNNVAVSYSFVDTNMDRLSYQKKTAWRAYAAGTAIYGQKDYLISESDLTDAVAVSKRDVFLGWHQLPTGTYSVGQGGNRATLYLSGWWSTLGWRYGSVAKYSWTSYTVQDQAQEVGSASTSARVMQTFAVGTQSVMVTGLAAWAKKTGTPADNFKLDIYALAAGTPTGASLMSYTCAGGLMNTSYAWYQGTATPAELRAGSSYAIEASRSGAADGASHYIVGVGTALGYTGGSLGIYNGTSYINRSPNADMDFSLSFQDKAQTSNIIREYVEHFGQFLTATDVDAASGVWMFSERDGQTTALDEITPMLEMGGTNARHLLAVVDINRRVHLYEEDASTTVKYNIDREGKITTSGGARVPAYKPPYGCWVRFKDVIPGGVGGELIADPTLQFIERAEWTPDGVSYTFRGQADDRDLVRISK